MITIGADDATAIGCGLVALIVLFTVNHLTLPRARQRASSPRPPAGSDPHRQSRG